MKGMDSKPPKSRPDSFMMRHAVSYLAGFLDMSRLIGGLCLGKESSGRICPMSLAHALQFSLGFFLSFFKIVLSIYCIFLHPCGLSSLDASSRRRTSLCCMQGPVRRDRALWMHCPRDIEL